MAMRRSMPPRIAPKAAPMRPAPKAAPSAGKKMTNTGVAKNAAMEDRRSFVTGNLKSPAYSGAKEVLSGKDIGKTGNAKVATSIRKQLAYGVVNRARGVSSPYAQIPQFSGSDATGITASQSLAGRREDTKATAPTAAAKAASRRAALAKFGTGSREVPRQQTRAKAKIKQLESSAKNKAQLKANTEEIARLKKKFNLK